MRHRKADLVNRALLAGLAALAAACAPTDDGAVPGDPAIGSRFVHLAPGVPAVLYEPADAGAKAGIAIMIMHSGGDYLTHVSCTEFAARGYRALCANNSSSKSARNTDLDIYQTLIELGMGVDYLRSLPGVSKVVLMGHSGGGALAAAYQNVAENGVAACRGEAMLSQCPDSLAGLPPADGVALLDSNYGLSTMFLFSIDPAVLDESTGARVDPALDSYSAENGFDPQGARYPEEFVERFQRGVAERNNRLIDAALARVSAIEAGEGLFLDDEPLTIPGSIFLGVNNKLFSEDTRLLGRTRGEWPLLHADGSVETTVVQSVRRPRASHSLSPVYADGAMKTTVKRFLSTFAVRVNDDFAYGPDFIRGIVWESSITAPVYSARGIRRPLLAMGMSAGYEFMAAELIYENAASEDKTIAFVEGATHVFRPCTACETTPGQYGDTVKTLFDYVDGWLSEPGRFLAP